MIKFISYSGSFPNLCSGELVIEVDGKRYSITDCISGGSVWFDESMEEHVDSGEWTIGSLPENLEPYRNEITKVMNDNVPYGCCGGCV